MRVTVDATKCQGYGACAQHCPAVFELDEWGFASTRADGLVPDDHEDAAAAAIADCPEHAISEIVGGADGG
jgi:ferredoxin